MGNAVSSSSIALARGSATADSYVAELVDIQYERSMGTSRFMKTIRCAHREGTVVVKVFLKPETGLALHKYKDELRMQRTLLATVPNVLFHQRILESDRAAYLVRRFVFSSLYDRISTRPFLHSEEKKWFAFQLLQAVDGAHGKGICHGDIKAENVLVTAWGWVYLVDFAPFKPAVVPDDNPTDFSFFFDSSTRRACYLAPERFVTPASVATTGSKLEPTMDVFSVGCVIAELFLDGHPLFTLAQLLRYRDGTYDPSVEINKIPDHGMR
ncbi:Serine/threonine-protein kinase, partial [Gonapodya sp. JEL0774]